jgi:hypothetical protein
MLNQAYQCLTILSEGYRSSVEEKNVDKLFLDIFSRHLIYLERESLSMQAVARGSLSFRNY